MKKKKNNNRNYRKMQINSNLRHGRRTFNTVNTNTTEETVNISKNATNISTSQQNHQHQKPITLKHKAKRPSRNHRHRKRHAHEDSKQRDVREANFYMEVEHEPLPQALQQRMMFDDSLYEDDDDDDDDDDEDDYNPRQQQSPVINIDRSFHINMDQPMKVLTLGGSNEAEKPEAAHKPHNAQHDDDDDDDEDNNSNNNNNPLSAINIISTPLEEFEVGLRDNSKKKTTQSFTDFDALAPVSESSNRKTASSNSKMMPVLTADGKVALLYREDEDTTVKNEHLNVTSQADNNKQNNKNEGKQEDGAVLSDDYDYDADDDDEDVDEEIINATIMQKLNDAAKSNDGPAAADVQKDAESAEEARVAAAQAPTSSSSTTLLRPTDSILPMINRPLSEVLGIKKNQFKTFRIKDDATTSTSTTSTTTTSTSTVPTPPAHVLASGIEVVPHEAPKQHFIPAQTALREFDFSHDSTMLDERSREGKTQPPNTQDNEVLTPTDFIDLAMLPHIEQELTRLQQQEKRRHYHSKRNKHRPRTAEELSSIHFVMQIMMAIAAVSTVFGMLGTFFKQRILDQLRMLH